MHLGLVLFYMGNISSEISGGHFIKFWGGSECRGLVRFICPSHGRGIRGHAPTGKFKKLQSLKCLSSILRDGILQNSKGREVHGRHDFLVDYFRSQMNVKRHI